MDWQQDPELAEAAKAIEHGGWTSADCAAKVAMVDDHGAGVEPIRAFKNSLSYQFENDSFKRVLLLHTADENRQRVGLLPVHPKVRQLLLDDFQGFAKKKDNGPSLGTPMFETCSKLATLRRFPAGAMDWEISGVPRSWMVRAGVSEGAKLAWFLTSRLGGAKPIFFMHVALRPKNRAMVIEKEVQRAYYRMADSLRGWPESKGIVAYGWFHDPAAVKDNPHLQFLNQPYVECGGLFRLEAATPASGFAENNPERLRQYEAGELKYHMYAALWPRAEALAWVERHPEFNG